MTPTAELDPPAQSHKARKRAEAARTRIAALFTVPLLLAALALLSFFSVRMNTLGEAWAERKARGIAAVLASSVVPPCCARTAPCSPGTTLTCGQEIFPRPASGPWSRCVTSASTSYRA